MVCSVAAVLMDRALAEDSPGSRVRFANCTISVLSLLSLGGIGLLILEKYSRKDFPQRLVGPMAILELIFFAATLNVFGSFYYDFRGWDITLDIVPSRGSWSEGLEVPLRDDDAVSMGGAVSVDPLTGGAWI